ncbi:MAG TPA: nucleoside monophosphate kinase [Bryobacteraceae bacterium]|nr:nucleoside monophosphate kinase [Bryobacteraceae bacterium]
MDRKVIILLGPPGCGKGTQAARLSACLAIPAISTGEILRQECQSGSALGKAVEKILQSGQLVSDGLMNQVVASRLGQLDCANGCILDGYPRTAAQARFLDRLLRRLGMPSPVVIEFFVPAEEIVKRLSIRGRADDNRETILERLRIHESNSAEVTAYYRMRTYHRIAATDSPAQICETLLDLLEKDWPGALVGAHAMHLGAGTHSW